MFIAEDHSDVSAPAERYVFLNDSTYIPLLTERGILEDPGYKHFTPPEQEPRRQHRKTEPMSMVSPGFRGVCRVISSRLDLHLHDC